MKRFVILNTRRTGSNLLCTLLDSHPDILCHHEVFNDDGVYLSLDQRDSMLAKTSVLERDRDPIGFLNQLWAAGSEWPVVGFKMTGELNKAVLETVLHDRQVRKIVLYRRSRLRSFVSEKIATLLNEWEVYRPEDRRAERPNVRVDSEELMATIAAADQFYQRVRDVLSSTGQSAIEVAYTQLADPKEHQRLLRFLGVRDPERPLRARSIKLNAGSLRDLVSNYEELASELRGTSLEWELADDAERFA